VQLEAIISHTSSSEIKKNILGIEIIPEQNKIFEDKIKII